MKEHNAGPALHFRARLEDMHPYAVNVVNKAGAYACRENRRTVRRSLGRTIGRLLARCAHACE
jgi:hypothetical protein